jgi:ABC-type sugar transport system ATPase subunit
MTPPALRVERLTKTFPGTQALADLSFDVHAGEVHAVVGENGAGKTTLLMILSGVYAPDAGRVLVDEREVTFARPSDAIATGIGTVFQELSLVDGLSVADNVFANRAPTRGPGVIDRRRMRREARALLAALGSDVRPDHRVRSLGLGDRQEVEIAKALSLNARILLLDEPTSALSAEEASRLFALMRRLTERGIAVVFVSHRLAEVFEVADRITVLRDGRNVAEYARGEADELRVVHSMVGRTLSALYPARAAAVGDALVELHGARRGDVGPVDLDVRAGEILAIAGLRGSGRSTVARLLAGAERLDAGELRIGGRVARLRHPWQALGYGIAFVPADRKGEGLFAQMSLSGNLVAGALRAVSAYGLVRRSAVSSLAGRLRREFDIRARSVEQRVDRLSGGNQQKAMLGRSIATAPRVLVIDEPTQGVDIGAKTEIHARLRALAETGIGVVIVTSELPEALGMADRIAVVARGRVRGVLEGATATEEQVMELAAGVAA